jgi:hypothetical protein
VSHKFGSSDNVISRIEYKFVFKKLLWSFIIQKSHRSYAEAEAHTQNISLGGLTLKLFLFKNYLIKISQM